MHYLLTPWRRVLLEKLTGLQLVKNFPAFHGTRWFITALTSVRHLSLSWASPIQSIYPHPTSWISVLILSTHLPLGLPSGLLPSGFPSKNLYTPLSTPIRTTCPAKLDTIISQIYSWNKTVHVSDNSSVHRQEFFAVHTAMVYVIQGCWQLASRITSVLILLTSCQQTCMTYTIVACTVKNSRWWTEELSETCRVLFQK